MLGLMMSSGQLEATNNAQEEAEKSKAVNGYARPFPSKNNVSLGVGIN